MMLYKRIVLPKGKKGGGNSTLDYNDKTIDFLPQIIISGSNTSRNEKQNEIKKDVSIKKINNNSILNTQSSTLDYPSCCTFDDNTISYRYKELIYDGKVFNNFLYFRKKESPIIMKPKYPLKLTKYISKINQSHLTTRNLPKLTILNPKFSLKKSINFQNSLLQTKLHSLEL